MFHQLNVVLAEGETAPGFIERVQVLGAGRPVLTGSLPEYVDAGREAIGPVARALVIGALLLGAVVLLLGGQALVRQAASEAGDDPTLAALGFTGGRLTAVRSLKAGAIGAGAALVAGVVAAATTPLFPLGLAEVIEPDPGFRLDVAALAAGVPAICLSVAVLGAAAGVWVTRRSMASTGDSPPVARPARWASLPAGVGARPPVVVGIRAALRGGAGGAVSASVGTIAIGLLATIGATVFGASLTNLTETPALYGWTWDLRLGQPFAPAFAPEQIADVATEPAVAALAVGNEAEVVLGGRRLLMLGLEQVVGDIEPALITGRAATALNEVVVTSGVGRLGERLTATFADVEIELHVVGIAALPDVDAAVTLATLRRFVPDTPTQLALVRAADRGEAASLREQLVQTLELEETSVAVAELDQDVANFGRVDRLPSLLAGLMGAVAIGALLHALVLGVGRRRRELAVLKVLGFTRRQILGTVTAHASTLAVLAIAVGVPLGVAAGRTVWFGFAESLGVVGAPVVPGWATGAIVAVALAVANLAALVPGWRASRLPAALVLRSE